MNKYTYQPETLEALAKLRNQAPGTVAERDALAGINGNEPILIMMDSAIRFAKAYRARFETTISDDYVLNADFGGILAGIRALLNYDGAVKMESDKGTDSKDNGMIENLYWTACEIAGLDGENL